MNEKRVTGRQKFDGKDLSVSLSYRSLQMLTTIQEEIGATSLSEAVRFLINDYSKNISNSVVISQN